MEDKTGRGNKTKDKSVIEETTDCTKLGFKCYTYFNNGGDQLQTLYLSNENKSFYLQFLI